MGASLGLAGLSGCIRWPEEKLAPYAHRPHNRLPGQPVSYATAMELGGMGQGLLAVSFDGRPIKIEGNPTHPLNQGAADAIAQASVLEVYDPDRSRGVVRREGDTHTASSWAEFVHWADGQFSGDGAGFCILSEASTSPSLLDMRQRLEKAMPKAQWFQYEPLSEDNVREGTRLAFGRPLRAVPELGLARVIVALDADLFGGASPLAIKLARDFAAGRRLNTGKGDSPIFVERKSGQSPSAAGEGSGGMNRLYVAESIHSITGACADHRRAMPPSAIVPLAARIAGELGVIPPPNPPVQREGGRNDKDTAFVDSLVKDLKQNPGRSLVVAGPRQPAEVNALVAAINHKLGNIGKTIVYYEDPEPQRPTHVAGLRTLTEKMRAGQVQTLLILGGNPVYSAPADLGFAAALEKVPHSIHLALYDDETSQRCLWHLSRAHYLEAWGDVRTFEGTVSIVEPLIEPLFDGRSAIEVLAIILGDKTGLDGGGYEIVRRTTQALLGNSYTEWKWKQALFDGIIKDTAWKPAALGVDKGTVPFSSNENRDSPPTAGDWSIFRREGAVLRADDGRKHGPVPFSPAEGQSPGTFEVVFFSDGKVYDGRFANNGWLEELPEPMTRLTWDNAAVVSPQTAAELGAQRDELLALKSGEAELLAPMFILPGMPDGVVALALGYGRKAAGRLGSGVGSNAYLLRTSDNLGWRSGVGVTATGQKYPLATVQDHHIVDEVGRQAVRERIPELIREGTFQQYQHDPALGIRKAAAISIFDEHRFDGRVDGAAPEMNVPRHDFHKWGLAVDLTVCTGCGACVVACQAENNVPIVGKEQVLHGREMHWLRVDRYFRETPDAAVAVHQPVLCMHCETAPCEEVCPVAATTHSQEGLNMMSYNRCIGTRYCSNNCPYKVRRFNFFDYNRGTLKDLYVPNLAREPISELLKMQKNPDVTVRMRGVMEKCTYCVQRIEHARITAKREGDRPIPDGQIQTACQQTCPTRALVFGDLNDPQSRVSKLLALPRTYGLLDEQLNTKPRTQYVAKVRNPAPGLDPPLPPGEGRGEGMLKKTGV
jgi:molybdopterin-containing oxidoreductase family iron-sulfur binding subunit